MIQRTRVTHGHNNGRQKESSTCIAINTVFRTTSKSVELITEVKMKGKATGST